MGQNLQRPGSSSRSPGCSRSVIVFDSLAIIFFAAALVAMGFTLIYLFGQPSKEIENEAVANLQAWVRADELVTDNQGSIQGGAIDPQLSISRSILSSGECPLL